MKSEQRTPWATNSEMDIHKAFKCRFMPFGGDPPGDFFKTETLDRHLKTLEQSILDGRGVHLVIGEEGAGKTSFCGHLGGLIAPDTSITTIFLSGGGVSGAVPFLETLAASLGLSLSPADHNESALKGKIKNFLFHQCAAHRRKTLLLIDDGQSLPLSCLVILGEFYNSHINAAQLLQLVLFGDKDFPARLSSVKDLANRVCCRVNLKFFTFSEMGDFIDHRLSLAGCPRGGTALFSLSALRLMHGVTRGNVKKVGELGHLIMMTLFVRNRAKAGWFLARNCASMLWPGRVFMAEGIRGGAWFVSLTLLLMVGLQQGWLNSSSMKTASLSTIEASSDNETAEKADVGGEAARTEEKGNSPSSPTVVDRGGEPEKASLQPYANDKVKADSPHETPPAMEDLEHTLAGKSPQTVEEPRQQVEGFPSPPSTGTVTQSVPAVLDGFNPSAGSQGDVADDVDKSSLSASDTVNQIIRSLEDEIPAKSASIQDNQIKDEPVVPQEPPSILGDITVHDNETLGDMIRGIYGPYSFNPRNTKKVLAANPRMKDGHMIRKGMNIQFPAIPVTMPQETERIWWLQVNRLDTLQGAYRYLRTNKANLPPLVIIPGWDARGDLRFWVLLEESFPEKAAAARRLAELPAPLLPVGDILAGLRRDRFYFQKKSGGK